MTQNKTLACRNTYNIQQTVEYQRHFDLYGVRGVEDGPTESVVRGKQVLVETILIVGTIRSSCKYTVTQS